MACEGAGKSSQRPHGFPPAAHRLLDLVVNLRWAKQVVHYSCQQHGTNANLHLTTSTHTSKGSIVPGELLNTFRDQSGRITVGVFRRVSAPAQHHHDVGADVPDGWVVVGGGAVATDRGNGALLTASYPNSELTAWLASSKDHNAPESHILTCFALGMRIEGMTATDLRGAIHIETGDSGWAPHPEATAKTPDGFILLGGGAKVEWEPGPGNLLTGSFPSTDRSWTVRSKDHLVSSPANIRSWAIGLRRNLPVGTVVGSIRREDSGVSAHPSVAADVSDGFALSGGGANINWHGGGNLLWRLEPTTDTTNQEFRASGKDHIVSDPASITAFSMGVRLHP